MTVKPDFSTPSEKDVGFTKPLDEALRFSTNQEMYANERRQSGGLSDDPADNPVDATDGNGKPYKF